MASLAGIEQLRAAVVDGRTQNVRYRQNELQSFHETLSNNADKIRAAISQDLNGSSTGVSSEAEAEYYYAMSAVKHFYSSLDFEKSLKDEYLLANGADNVSRRVGKGLVIIRPTTHTRFYSIVSPTVAALTAGNCVCLEVRRALPEYNT
jgi:acyl-CoA reductase-like NAD-dependent aldehyde dehydrogenase